MLISFSYLFIIYQSSYLFRRLSLLIIKTDVMHKVKLEELIIMSTFCIAEGPPVLEPLYG